MDTRQTTTDHMTDQKGKFITFPKESSSIEIADKSKFKAVGYGNVLIELSSECDGKHVTLTNTLYVPDLN